MEQHLKNLELIEWSWRVLAKDHGLKESCKLLTYLFVDEYGSINNLVERDDKSEITERLAKTGLFKAISKNPAIVEKELRSFFKRKMVKHLDSSGKRVDTYENFCIELGRFVIENSSFVDIGSLSQFVNQETKAIEFSEKKVDSIPGVDSISESKGGESQSQRLKELKEAKPKSKYFTKYFTKSNGVLLLFSLLISIIINYILFEVAKKFETLDRLPKPCAAILLILLLALVIFALVKAVLKIVWWRLENPTKNTCLENISLDALVRTVRIDDLNSKFGIKEEVVNKVREKCPDKEYVILGGWHNSALLFTEGPGQKCYNLSDNFKEYPMPHISDMRYWDEKNNLFPLSKTFMGMKKGLLYIYKEDGKIDCKYVCYKEVHIENINTPFVSYFTEIISLSDVCLSRIKEIVCCSSKRMKHMK